MKRARPTAAVFAMVVLAAALFGDARGGVAGERHFARIVNGGGWTTPTLGSPVDRGPYRPLSRIPPASRSPDSAVRAARGSSWRGTRPGTTN